MSDHFESILDNVLEMARLTDENVTLEVEPNRIDDVVEQALEIVQPSAAAASITLGSPVPRSLCSTPTRLGCAKCSCNSWTTP